MLALGHAFGRIGCFFCRLLRNFLETRLCLSQHGRVHTDWGASVADTVDRDRNTVGSVCRAVVLVFA